MPKRNRNRIPSHLLVEKITQSLRNRVAAAARRVRLHIATQNLPNSTALYDFLHLEHRRRYTCLQPNKRTCSRLPRELSQLSRPAGILRERPLDKNVLPGLDARFHGLVVHVHPRDTNYEIDIKICGEVLR